MQSQKRPSARNGEQWIQEGKQAVKMTRLSCHDSGQTRCGCLRARKKLRRYGSKRSERMYTWPNWKPKMEIPGRCFFPSSPKSVMGLNCFERLKLQSVGTLKGTPVSS